MLLAAMRPELFGPIIVAGSPLSYWAGVHGAKPHALHGRAAGRQLAHRADGRSRQRQVRRRLARQRTSRTSTRPTRYWTKHYNLYSKIDTEAPRYLEFEQWWGGHVLLNAEEMQFIADELFVGNKLATGRDRVVGRHARRSAQHPLADRRLLLEGRQHHAAAAGAGLDPRSLRQRRRHPGARPDHRLRRARVDRPSRHLRLGLRGEEGARRVRQQHRSHRRAAAGPLRGGDDAEGSERCAPPT